MSPAEFQANAESGDITVTDITDALEIAMLKWNGEEPDVIDGKVYKDWIQQEAPQSDITSDELYDLWEELMAEIEDMRGYAEENGLTAEQDGLHSDAGARLILLVEHRTVS